MAHSHDEYSLWWFCLGNLVQCYPMMLTLMRFRQRKVTGCSTHMIIVMFFATWMRFTWSLPLGRAKKKIFCMVTQSRICHRPIVLMYDGLTEN